MKITKIPPLKCSVCNSTRMVTTNDNLPVFYCKDCSSVKMRDGTTKKVKHVKYNNSSRLYYKDFVFE